MGFQKHVYEFHQAIKNTLSGMIENVFFKILSAINADLFLYYALLSHLNARWMAFMKAQFKLNK